MVDRTGDNLSGASPGWNAPRILGLAAMASAAAFGILLGIRTVTTPDLGYHLAYGETFLDTGRIVDSNEFLYTLPRPSDASRPDVGPGCWYDDAGRYRFPNANWLTQVVMAAVYRAGGEKALGLVQAALVAAIVLLGLLTLRRLDVPPVWRAAGTVLIVIVAQGRFTIRPEVFGYLALAAQMCILADGPRTWRGAAALIALQLLAVNLHSYFLLGLALTGAFLADRLARLLWQRLRRQPSDDAAARDARRLGMVLAAQLAACMANPWGWRLAVLPIQTLLFIRRHGIAGGGLTGLAHPWASIGEFFRPFAAGAFLDVKATYGYCVLLVLTALGALAAAFHRRWDRLLILAGMTAVSLSMRRNIAPAALLITPLALAEAWQCLSGPAGRMRARLVTRLSAVAAAAVTLASLGLCLSVVTQHYYYTDRSAWRFGLGVSRLLVPVDAAEWLNTRKPRGRLWTDYTSSSNLYYFTRPHPEVPILTNTWAYPPEVMRSVLACSSGQVPFRRTEEAFHPQVVALLADRTSAVLAGELAADPAWTVTYVDARHVVFIRADGPNADLARTSAITAETLDLADYKARVEASDPLAHYATCLGGITLFNLGWDAPAIDLFARTVELRPDYYQAWDLRGLTHLRRGHGRLLAGDPAARRDLEQALLCFDRALRIHPDYEEAINHRDQVRRLLAAP